MKNTPARNWDYVASTLSHNYRLGNDVNHLVPPKMVDGMFTALPPVSAGVHGGRMTFQTWWKEMPKDVRQNVLTFAKQAGLSRQAALAQIYTGQIAHVSQVLIPSPNTIVAFRVAGVVMAGTAVGVVAGIGFALAQD